METLKMKIDDIIEIIENEKIGTQQDKNINYYVVWHLEKISEYLYYENLDPEIENIFKLSWNNGSLIKTILNGAENFEQWSNGGLGLIYNFDLAKTLLTSDQFKKWENGDKYIDFLKMQAKFAKKGYEKIKVICREKGIKIKA